MCRASWSISLSRVRPLARLGLVLLALLLLPAGCGYRMVDGGDGLIAKRTLSLGRLVNKTYRPNLEAELARALREELSRRTAQGVVDRGELELGGTIQSLIFEPASFTAADRVREYRIALTVELLLKEQATGRILWKGTEAGTQYFPTNGDLALQRNSEEQAVAAVCRDLAERIYQQLSRTF